MRCPDKWHDEPPRGLPVLCLRPGCGHICVEARSAAAIGRVLALLDEPARVQVDIGDAVRDAIYGRTNETGI